MLMAGSSRRAGRLDLHAPSLGWSMALHSRFCSCRSTLPTSAFLELVLPPVAPTPPPHVCLTAQPASLLLYSFWDLPNPPLWDLHPPSFWDLPSGTSHLGPPDPTFWTPASAEHSLEDVDVSSKRKHVVLSDSKVGRLLLP